jgi:NADPH:quinone reductase-like Zn-dependent oxidoreductase
MPGVVLGLGVAIALGGLQIGGVTIYGSRGLGMVAQEVDLAWRQGPYDVLVTLLAASLYPAHVFSANWAAIWRRTGPLFSAMTGWGLWQRGAQVSGLHPGDRVCFCNGGIGGTMGTYA